MELKAGGRIRSAVCTTEMMVILAPHGDADLRCGGAPMLALGTEPPGDGSIADDAKGGTQIGKRYIDADGGLELLCTKPGDGSLTLAGTELTIKGAKPLPSSD